MFSFFFLLICLQFVYCFGEILTYFDRKFDVVRQTTADFVYVLRFEMYHHRCVWTYLALFLCFVDVHLNMLGNFPYQNYTSQNLFHFQFWFVLFSTQVHIDNEKCRREREARLSGSKLDLSFCGPRVAATAPAMPTIDSHGNSLPPLTPQSNNNSSPIHDEPLTPAGNILFWLILALIFGFLFFGFFNLINKQQMQADAIFISIRISGQNRLRRYINAWILYIWTRNILTHKLYR